jgi:hypothetical protein
LQHFLLSYFKKLSVGPAGIFTHDLHPTDRFEKAGRPMFNQMSQSGGGITEEIENASVCCVQLQSTRGFVRTLEKC